MAQGKKQTVRERLAKARESSAERSKIFKELCQHIRDGFSLDSYGLLGEKSIKEWLETYPKEFISEDFDAAINEGRQLWERIGKQQANGTCHGNSATWKFCMTNKYRWVDKLDVSADVRGAVSVEVINYSSAGRTQATVSTVTT